MRFIIREKPVGSQRHYQGWPLVVSRLFKLSNGQGILFDDFVDASFSYKPLEGPHSCPWIGCFHHPAHVNSPLSMDKSKEVATIFNHEWWPESRRNLKAAVALSDELAGKLTKDLGVRVCSLKHPVEVPDNEWDKTCLDSQPTLLQAGLSLRNTRLIFCIDKQGWRRTRLFGTTSKTAKHRDELLDKELKSEYADAERVLTMSRVKDNLYDKLLRTSVVVDEAYGISASNLVVECIARGTPIIINWSQAVCEYLGPDYPLYYTDRKEIPGLLDKNRLLDAHDYLLFRSVLLPTVDQFCNQVRNFVKSYEV